MAKRYYEDFAPGMVIEHGPRPVTREEIVAFAAEFDPQPMHLDEEAARNSILGGLAASGWHTCALLMRMACDSFVLDSNSMGAPGVDEVKWLKPLRPGTNITLRAEVLETRISKSRPERGFVKLRMDILDEDGAAIMMLTTSMIMAVRAGAEAAAS
jgi:acyl dehydratase